MNSLLQWLRADFWNEEIIGKAVSLLSPIAGAHARLTRLGRGTLIDFDSSTVWHHPWFTEPRWSGERWTATVQPGFVNGLAPLAGAVSLLDRPELPLTFREIPGDADPIPPFFKALGVTSPASGVKFNFAAERVEITDPSPDPNAPEPRRLVACDIFVSVARPTYKIEATVIGNYLLGQIVDYSAIFDSSTLDRVGAAPRLRAAPRMPPVRAQTLAERLSGLIGDDGEDRRIISTVYLLSPPNPPPDAKPDVSWIPYVKHATFWNLSHAAKNAPPKNVRQSYGLGSLSALVGRYTIVPQATFGAMEAESQRLLAGVFNSTTNEGRFWTA